MAVEDETQQPPTRRSLLPYLLPRAWARWFEKAKHIDPAEPEATHEGEERLGVHSTLRALPRLLEDAGLPNGVVEMLIEDFEAPTRHLFDIHDGHVTPVDPGKCVPWACIAGPATAWASALGQTRDTTGLQLTGDKQLARLVLAALQICNRGC